MHSWSNPAMKWGDGFDHGVDALIAAWSASMMEETNASILLLLVSPSVSSVGYIFCIRRIRRSRARRANFRVGVYKRLQAFDTHFTSLGQDLVCAKCKRRFKEDSCLDVPRKCVDCSVEEPSTFYPSEGRCQTCYVKARKDAGEQITKMKVYAHCTRCLRRTKIGSPVCKRCQELLS